MLTSEMTPRYLSYLHRRQTSQCTQRAEPAYKESNSNAFSGADSSPEGAGIRSMMASNTFSTPLPVFADM